MFCKLVVFSGLLALALSLPQQQVPIISQSEDSSPDGSYNWNYQSGDGTSQQQSGQLKQLGHDAGQVVQGSSSWTDPEGGQHKLIYSADEKGFQPESADLPVGHPVPAAIVRAIKWIAAHQQPQYQQ